MTNKGEAFKHYRKKIPTASYYEGMELLHYTDTTTGPILPHEHNMIEIMLIMDGDVEICTEETVYEAPKGSLILIPPHIVHYTVIPGSVKRYERIVAHVFPQYLDLVIKQISQEPVSLSCTRQLCVVKYTPDSQRFFRSFFERAFYVQMQSADYQKLMSPCLVIELFVELEHLLQLQNSPPKKDSTCNYIVAAVIDYIDENFTNPELTVKEIVSNHYVSQGYLSRMFKAYTGSSIQHFLTMKRLNYACELLQSGYTVLDSCIACGFTDYTCFLKSFKKAFAATPAQYQKNYTAKK